MTEKESFAQLELRIRKAYDDLKARDPENPFLALAEPTGKLLTFKRGFDRAYGGTEVRKRYERYIEGMETAGLEIY